MSRLDFKATTKPRVHCVYIILFEKLVSDMLHVIVTTTGSPFDEGL